MEKKEKHVVQNYVKSVYIFLRHHIYVEKTYQKIYGRLSIFLISTKNFICFQKIFETLRGG